MKNNWTKVLLAIGFITSTLPSCKPTPDTDTPFPVKVSPTIFTGSKKNFVYAINPENGVKKWEVNVHAEVNSSPYLYGGTLFVGNNSSVLYKIDPNTGVLDQSKIPFSIGISTCPVGKDNFLFVSSGANITSIDIKPDTIEWNFTAGGTINSSPIVKDTQIVFGCDDGYVYMLDNRNGNLIWKSINYATPFKSSPTMDNNNIYIGANNFKIYALDRKTGSEVWNYATAAPVVSSPIVIGGNVMVGSDDGFLYCMDIPTGLPRWKTKTADRVRSSPFLYINGFEQTVFVGSYDKSLYAINALDGSIKWSFPSEGLIQASPIVYKDQVIIGSYDMNLYSLDVKTGKVTWKFGVDGLMDCSPTADANASNGGGINSSISGASEY